jgi:hypothetical protein
VLQKKQLSLSQPLTKSLRLSLMNIIVVAVAVAAVLVGAIIDIVVVAAVVVIGAIVIVAVEGLISGRWRQLFRELDVIINISIIVVVVAVAAVRCFYRRSTRGSGNEGDRNVVDNAVQLLVVRRVQRRVGEEEALRRRHRQRSMSVASAASVAGTTQYTPLSTAQGLPGGGEDVGVCREDGPAREHQHEHQQQLHRRKDLHRRPFLRVGEVHVVGRGGGGGGEGGAGGGGGGGDGVQGVEGEREQQQRQAQHHHREEKRQPTLVIVVEEILPHHRILQTV